LHAIIVDDEPLSLDILEKYVQDVPNLVLEARCLNAFEAISELQSKKIDLIFLDINMPKLSGINMIKSLEDPPMVIFTTAYPEFAVEGFELNAVDYLVKPIAFDRFLKAVNKASKKLELEEMKTDQANTSSSYGFLSVKSNKKIYRINQADILYIQSYGDYTKIITAEKTLISNETLKSHEENLPSNLFMRIHKSYLISLDKVQYLEGNTLRIGENSLPIGYTYREEVLSKINSR
jgi:DNA-binding LytR/AlgR family response regulator